MMLQSDMGELSQLVRIDSITLTRIFQQGILARTTNYDLADLRLQQVVQPGRPVQRASHGLPLDLTARPFTFMG